MDTLFGGGTSTATTTPGPASPEEKALQAEALITSRIRNQLLREQITAQGGFFAGVEGGLETGLGATAAEEDRFGILGGETLGGTGAGADIRALLQEFAGGGTAPGTPPPSALIGTDQDPAAATPSGEGAALDILLAAGGETAAAAQSGAIKTTTAGLRARIAENQKAFDLAEGNLNPEFSGITGQMQQFLSQNKSLRQALAATESAELQSAVQGAVARELQAQGGQGVPQDFLDRLETLLSQTPPGPGEGTTTAAGEGIRQKLFQKQLDLIEQGGRATEQDIADIKRAADAASAEGALALSNFAERQLIDIRDILTPSRGLRPGDTPIRDAGGRVGAEATRQFGELQQRLRTVQAQQELSLPLTRQGFTAELTGFQQNLAQAAREFQVGLRQQAFENRLRLAATRSGAFANLLGVPFAGTGALQASAATRGSTTTSTQPPDILGGLQKIGAVAVAAQTVFSARDMKDEVAHVDADAVLNALADLPTNYWRYKSTAELHIGPYAEDFREVFGVGDGRTLAVVDVMGVMLTAVKALATRVKELEHANSG